MTDSSPRRRPDPDNLYHYQPLRSPEMMNWLRQTILHNQIYFSSPASFNDPFDCTVSPSFDGTSEQKRSYIERIAGLKFGSSTSSEARALIESAIADPKFFEKAYGSNQQKDIPTLGVYCLSERCDDILMWSHYADSHRGVSLILGGSQMYSDLALEPVYYPANNEYPNVNFFTSSMQEQVDAILLTKAKHWEYEREWRIIDTTGPGLHEIQSEWLLGLIFGCAMPVAQVAEISEMASQRNSPLLLFRAEKKKSEFALTIKPA